MADNSSFFSKLLPFILVLAIIFLDQFSKHLIELLGYEFSCNRGIAFGIGGSAFWLSFLVLVLVSIFAFCEKDFWRKIGLVLIFSGGLSNLIDRIYYGCVRDFISINLFPAFNIADIAITIGAVVVIFTYLARKSKQ